MYIYFQICSTIHNVVNVCIRLISNVFHVCIFVAASILWLYKPLPPLPPALALYWETALITITSSSSSSWSSSSSSSYQHHIIIITSVFHHHHIKHHIIIIIISIIISTSSSAFTLFRISTQPKLLCFVFLYCNLMEKLDLK